MNTIFQHMLTKLYLQMVKPLTQKHVGLTANWPECWKELLTLTNTEQDDCGAVDEQDRLSQDTRRDSFLDMDRRPQIFSTVKLCVGHDTIIVSLSNDQGDTAMRTSNTIHSQKGIHLISEMYKSDMLAGDVHASISTQFPEWKILSIHRCSQVNYLDRNYKAAGRQHPSIMLVGNHFTKTMNFNALASSQSDTYHHAHDCHVVVAMRWYLVRTTTSNHVAVQFLFLPRCGFFVDIPVVQLPENINDCMLHYAVINGTENFGFLAYSEAPSGVQVSVNQVKVSTFFSKGFSTSDDCSMVQQHQQYCYFLPRDSKRSKAQIVPKRSFSAEDNHNSIGCSESTELSQQDTEISTFGTSHDDNMNISTPNSPINSNPLYTILSDSDESALDDMQDEESPHMAFNVDSSYPKTIHPSEVSFLKNLSCRLWTNGGNTCYIDVALFVGLCMRLQSPRVQFAQSGHFSERAARVDSLIQWFLNEVPTRLTANSKRDQLCHVYKDELKSMHGTGSPLGGDASEWITCLINGSPEIAVDFSCDQCHDSTAFSVFYKSNYFTAKGLNLSDLRNRYKQQILQTSQNGCPTCKVRPYYCHLDVKAPFVLVKCDRLNSFNTGEMLTLGHSNFSLLGIVIFSQQNGHLNHFYSCACITFPTGGRRWMMYNDLYTPPLKELEGTTIHLPASHEVSWKVFSK
mmetsp:Transcript_2437/g.9184  ORF Transcript_2437/g.9184 Transcript_2437/m.9184 type:complete len:685 (-) Transcript_2437:1279-3333(-)